MIGCLNWLGFCESYSSVYQMRNVLANVDELVLKKQAALGVCHIIFDNLDLYIRKLHHLTLPILMFELYPTFHLPNSDERSFQEALKLFSYETLDLNSSTNKAEKDHFLLVVKTVLAHEICNDIDGLEWITKFFEKHHPHKHSLTAASRSCNHVDPPIALDEKKLQDMTQILTQFVERYLTLMAENLEGGEKERFFYCKKKVEQMNCSETELRESERFLMDTARKFGFLILHGDLLR